MILSSTTVPSFKARNADRPRRSRLISLTPLIDVVFILLLFFMLAYTFTDEHRITLDTPAHGTQTQGIEGALLVEVRTDGVRFAGRYLPMEQLIARVRGAAHEHPDQRVLVRSSNGVTLQDTVRVLDALSTAGIRHISLMDAAAGSAVRKP